MNEEREKKKKIKHCVEILGLDAKQKDCIKELNIWWLTISHGFCVLARVVPREYSELEQVLEDYQYLHNKYK